jgi:DNA-binding NtrC family response regulator
MSWFAPARNRNSVTGTSQSVADALGTIEQKPFDAYVIDYKLLDGSGLDVADSIRSKRNEAPIVFMSGYNTSSVASRAEKFHAFFLQKPFSRETICYAVKKAMGSAKGSVGLIRTRLDADPSTKQPATGRLCSETP